ncbi:MAG: MFS transporter, partial [Pseudolabrys sp.]
MASVALVLTTLGMITAERKLAAAPQPAPEAPAPRAIGTFTTAAAVFALGMVVLALGYQMHFSLGSAALYLRFAKAADLEWLMPIFWIGFNIAMFPAGVITNRIGGYAVMGVAALIGALAILATHLAQGLEQLVVAQFISGAAWGAILM